MALAIHFHDRLQQPHAASLREETLRGFAATPKRVSPKFFYDRRGSELFEQICQQPEYYLTRTEERILAHLQAAKDLGNDLSGFALHAGYMDRAAAPELRLRRANRVTDHPCAGQ